jgi:ornithine--oxo-acid transaminase
VAIAALNVLVDEDLAARAGKLGEIFRRAVRDLRSPLVAEVRGRGLLNAVVIDEAKSARGRTAWQLCLLLKSRGVLAKPTHDNMYAGRVRAMNGRSRIGSIRFAPPLVIEEADLLKAVKTFGECLKDLDKVCMPLCWRCRCSSLL